jgi:hypothetical protein
MYTMIELGSIDGPNGVIISKSVKTKGSPPDSATEAEGCASVEVDKNVTMVRGMIKEMGFPCQNLHLYIKIKVHG